MIKLFAATLHPFPARVEGSASLASSGKAVMGLLAAGPYAPFADLPPDCGLGAYEDANAIAPRARSCGCTAKIPNSHFLASLGTKRPSARQPCCGGRGTSAAEARPRVLGGRAGGGVPAWILVAGDAVAVSSFHPLFFPYIAERERQWRI
jgi:hypothetical protein